MLLAAISAGDTSRVSQLLELGVHLKKTGDTTPPLQAVIDRDIDIVNLLIQNNADVEECLGDTGLPLRMAAKLGYIEIAMLLLDTGKANKDGYQDFRGMFAGRDAAPTSLSSAAAGGHIDIVKLLLERQCDANARDKGGSNIALVGALKSGNISIIRMLLDYELWGNFFSAR